MHTDPISQLKPDGSSLWDESPSINLPERAPPANGGFSQTQVSDYIADFGKPPVYHQGPGGIKAAIDDVFTGMNKDPNNPGAFTLAERNALVAGLHQVYTSSEFGHLRLWPVTRDWLKVQTTGLNIPN